MKFEMSQKGKFFLLASLVFFGVSVASSVLGWLGFAQLSFLCFGPLTGLGAFVHGLVGVVGVIIGLLLGTLIALVINVKLGKKWGVPERVKLTCLSFLVFLGLLWGVIVAVARM